MGCILPHYMFLGAPERELIRLGVGAGALQIIRQRHRKRRGAMHAAPVISPLATVRPSQPDNALVSKREEVDGFVHFLT